jgi:hypothetical protein
MANQRDNERSNNNQSGRSSNEDSGDMTVREAGQKGGQRVRELVEEGKESEGGGRGNSNR